MEQTGATFEIGACIHEGTRTRIFQGRLTPDGRPVVIKQLQSLYPSPDAIATLSREYEVIRAATGTGVIEALDLRRDDRTVSIVLEDFGGTSLVEVADARPLPAITALEIIVQVAEALARLHDDDIVHKDISPANIVWNADTGVAKLIDFGMSQVLPSQAAPPRPMSRFEGTPGYVSPEQTGRMNRAVDRRSDLYSLGATLYELLTGRPPFASGDPLALIHAHLAKTPPAPRTLDPAIPDRVSELVMVLLSKRAEDRYQSAAGLVRDLRRCLDALQAGGPIPEFPLRQDDADGALHIPQHLYGRRAEVTRLRTTFEQAAAGRTELLLVSGYSGIGKTSLVHELHPTALERGARFVEGKFDQYSRATPYQSLIQALGDLVRLVLGEALGTVEAFRQRVLDAIGDNGGVLIEVLPEIEHVLGPQPPVPELSAAEARNRFQLVMASFVRAVASAQHPLVIFLDDLQWADLPSIELIAKLVGDPESRHLLLIGAYRDNEVDVTHPLAVAIAQMEASGAAIDAIELGPLAEADVAELVTDAIGDVPGAADLARLCHARTGGNAFFLRRFLQGLVEDGLLDFDAATRTWTIAEITDRDVTDNVIDLLTTEIGRLSPQAQRALQVASCIGDTFDLATLALGLATTRRAALDGLREALEAELVRPDEEGFWYVEDVDEVATNFTCAFVHDRIRQAAHASLEELDAAGVHLVIGRRLAESLEDPAEDPRLFDVVEHLDMAAAAGLVTDDDEIDGVCELNLAAGRRAVRSAAFDQAHVFFGRARRSLGPDPWRTAYERTLAVHVEGARAAYLSGDHAVMEELVAAAIDNARTLLDRVEAEEVAINALVAAQRLDEAVDAALDVLAQLGVEVPRRPTEADVEAAVASTLARLAEHPAEEILALPLLEDPEAVAAQRIENLIMSSAYLAVPTLLPILAADIIERSLDAGLSPASTYGFAIFALVLSAANVIDVGYENGQIARRMLDRFDDRIVQTRTLHVFWNLVKPWTDPLAEIGTDQLRTFQLGIDAGDLEYAAWALHSIAANMFYASAPLPEHARTTAHYLQVMEHHQQLPAIACTAVYAQLMANLMGGAEDPALLVGPGFDEAATMAELTAVNFRGAAFILTTLGLYSRCLFGHHAEAVTHADAGAEFADGATATYHQVWFHQYRTLAVLAQLAAGEGLDGAGIDRASLDASIEQLRTWNHFAPANHAHRVLLVDAELARIDGDAGLAADRYDRAVEAARAGGFLNEEALANERCGRFHLARGSETAGRAYLLEACYGYARWGATAKVDQLVEEHRTVLQGLVRSGTADLVATPSGGSASYLTDTLSGATAGLDLTSLFKAANVITSEARLDALLRRILDVAIENAGATRGYLVVDRDGTLVIGAARDVEASDLVQPGTPLTDCPDVHTGVVSYVARTGEPVVLADAASDPLWGTPGTGGADPASVLCAPVAHGGSTSGIVFLANDLMAGAFTPARLQVLDLLSTQAAISIQNASATEELRRHHDRLEELVRERTRELDEALAELRQANAVLDRLSMTDALTGLPNRRHFDQALTDLWRRARAEGTPVTVLMIDVDWFKAYNDHLGHQEGDACLRRIAGALSGDLLRAGDLVARYGGEEFAAILPGVDAARAAEIGEAMLAAVRALAISHAAAPTGDQVTISIGAATVDPRTSSPDELIAQADRRLYAAKSQGRDRLAS